VPSYAEILAAARAAVREVAPAEALADGPLVIDVREPDERAEGMVPAALAIPRGVLEPSVEYAVFTLAPGELAAEPLDTPRGFWVVRRLR